MNENVIASHCEGDGWKFWDNFELKVNFEEKVLEFIPEGNINICLDKWKDHYNFNRPITAIGNLMSSNLMIDQFGKMEFINYATKDFAIIELL